MKVLIVGGGGREHALAWSVAGSRRVDTVYVAPGNAGTALEQGVRNVAIDAGNVHELVDFAAAQSIDLTIVGPEAPLVAGIVDAFTARGLACFGPTRAAARLEGSKTFSKDFLRRHNIPTADYASFTDLAQAEAYVRERGAPIVVKADGLAAGKGVILADSTEQALDAVRDCLAANRFGEAGHRVVIEEFLSGEEASFMVICDGTHALDLATSQDHKARDDGDTGPNTGGMGAYSPAPVVDDALSRRVMEEVINPTLRGMAEDGSPYTGFLYAGLMITADGTPKVLEFNCRMGDPETQPILYRLQSDLTELCEAALAGRLAGTTASWDPRPALGVVMAAGGYPGEYRKGDVISGLDVEMDDTKVFHAGTMTHESGAVTTSGGRVLCVCALGDDIAEAQSLAYARLGTLHFNDAYYRHDIGHRALGACRI